MLGVACACAIGGLATMGELGNHWLYYYVVRVPATHPLLLRSLCNGVAFVAGTMPLFIASAVLILRTRGPTSGPAAGAAAADDVPRRWTLLFVVSTVIMLALRLKQGRA
jgi:hypothetical protein